MEYCPHCMRPSSGERCGYCGGEINWQAPATQLPTGTLLRGTSGRMYQIGAAKGQGGFGITYAALDLSQNYRVAIKEYYPTRCATRDHLNNVVPSTGQLETYKGGMTSFLEEAKTLSAVGALPSVVSVRDYFEANGTAYLVMEYVDGIPLHEVLSRQGRMPKQQLFPLLPDLLRDLGILHRSGMIHRDISPDNLILTVEGSLKLLDFGSARSTENGKAMTVMLKAGFSPVEQYQSKGQGPYTDIYALAGTLYYCLTGKIPPTAIDRLTEDEIESPNSLGAGLTEQEEKALMWGLTLQPARRPQRMEAFAAALLGIPEQNRPITQEDPGKTDGNPKTGEFADAQAEKPVTVKHPTTLKKPATEKKPTTVKKPVTEKKPGGKKKKLLIPIIAAAVVLVAAVVGFLLFGMGGTTSNGFSYKLQNGGAAITDYEGSQRDLVIPNTVGGEKVIEIREDAFNGRRNLRSVTIPKGVTTVEAGAFRGCTGLELVILQGENTRLDKKAFSGCTKLVCILVPTELAYDRAEPVVEDMDGVTLLYVGQQMEGGILDAVEAEDGVVYAILENGKEIPLKRSEISVPDSGSTVPAVPAADDSPVSKGEVDGFTYEIQDGQAIITGYVGPDPYPSIPDTVEGVPVTILGANCFAGNTTMESLFLSTNIKEIRAGAFSNCTSILDLYVYSNITVDSTAFNGCSKLRVVMTSGPSVASWNLPADCQVYTDGMDLGLNSGLVITMVDEDGVIYGITEDQEAVLMNIPSGMTTVDVPDEVGSWPVVWTYNRINITSNTTINMGTNMGFPYELLYKATWNFKYFGDFSHSWLLTCTVCYEINEARGTAPRIYPDMDLVKAAMARSRELAQSFDKVRPDGSDTFDILDEYNVPWSYGTHLPYWSTDDDDEFSKNFDQIVAEVQEEFTGRNGNGNYPTVLGMAMYHDQGQGKVYNSNFAIEP